MTTRRQGGLSVFAAACAGLLLACGQAAGEETVFDISMSGGNGGDPDGSAQGTLTIDSTSGEIRWELSYSGIDEPTAMHIHQGAAGESGGVVVPLTVETSGPGRLAGSTTAEQGVIAEILAAPDRYYVNVHNAEHRPGAIRGQLAD